MQAHAARRRRERQRQIVYTRPTVPCAGVTADVFYNPDATLLRGRPQTWLLGGWNRGTHPDIIMPQQMQPTVPGGLGFHRSSVQVCAQMRELVSVTLVLVFDGDAQAGAPAADL